MNDAELKPADNNTGTPAGVTATEEPVEVKPDPPKRIAVLGEVPFSGKALSRVLLNSGLAVRVLCPDSAAEEALNALRPADDTGSVETVRGSLESETAIEAAMNGAHGAVLLSPITLNGRMYRPTTHLDDVRRVVAAAEKSTIRKLVYQSSLGAHESSGSMAHRQAAEADVLIKACRCEDFRVRTSLLIGPNDRFLTEMIRSLSAGSLVMGLMGYGDTRIQPIYIDDMARCVVRILTDKGELSPGAYNLAGPEILTLLDVIDAVSLKIGRFKLKFHAPLFLLKMLSSFAVKSTGFSERLELLFDNFCVGDGSEKNDAPTLSPGKELTTFQQVLNDLLERGAARRSPAVSSGLA